MRRNKWTGILVFVLLIAVAVGLSIVAARIGSDFLRCLAIVLPASIAEDLIAYCSGKESKIKIFSDKKRWWGFAAGVLIVTTLFWLFEKFVF